MTNRNPMQALAFLAIPAALLLLSVPAQADPFQGGDNGRSFGPSTQQGNGHFRSGNMDQAGGQMQGQDRQGQMMQQLGLSQQQSQKIKALMQQGRTQSQALHQQLKTKRQALMQYLQSPDANESKARSLNAEINDIQRQLSELRLKTWFGMRAQMTPEQIQKMNQMKGKFGGGMGEPGSGRRFGGQNGQPGGYGSQGGFGGRGMKMRQQGRYMGPDNNGDGPSGPDAGFAPPAPNFNNQPGYGPQTSSMPMNGLRIGAATPLGPDAEMQNGPIPENGPPPDRNDEGLDPNL